MPCRTVANGGTCGHDEPRLKFTRDRIEMQTTALADTGHVARSVKESETGRFAPSDESSKADIWSASARRSALLGMMIAAHRPVLVG